MAGAISRAKPLQEAHGPVGPAAPRGLPAGSGREEGGGGEQRAARHRQMHDVFLRCRGIRTKPRDVQPIA
jgi:hypothetical protein